MRIPLIAPACLLAVFAVSAIAADSPAAASPPYTVTPARVSQLKATTVVCRTLHIRAIDTDAESKGILEMRGIIAAAKLTPTGGPIVIFPQVPQDPTAMIDILIAMPVDDGSKAPDGCQLRVLPAAPMVTAIYQGSTDNIGAAIGEVFQQMGTLRQTPTGELRTRSLYFEDATSSNNVMLLEIPTTAPAAQ